jgi:hypothetical protein
VLDCILPSVYDTVFRGDWHSRLNGIADCNDATRRDFHPTPLEHVEYLDQVTPGLLTEPSARDWMAQCDELARLNRLNWNEPNRPVRRL